MAGINRISECTLRHWIKCEDRIRHANPNNISIHTGGTRINSELEDEIARDVMRLRDHGLGMFIPNAKL